MARPPLAALQAFVQIAHWRNLSRAAEQMNLTVSALSHQMRTLEERLGERLLIRGPRGVSLTPEGERLLDAVEAPIAAIERALKPPQRRHADDLSISMLATIASGWMVPRLPRLFARHPQLELQLHSGAALVDFSKEPIDAAMRFGPGNWPGLHVVHLFDEWVTPVASPKLLAERGPLRIEELSRWPLLGDPGDRWTDWFAQFGGTPPKRFVAKFGDTETLHRAATEGLGIALGRVTMTRALIETGRLVPLTPLRLRAEWSHYLVYPPRSANHPGVLAFRDWLLDEARLHVQELDSKTAPKRRRPGK
ncbi:LysR substrate-binding domain-containing protein [Tahibacter amnicola]|uniref:LysR substrate-binding domain-containing protein n=1 Tax=Tahibacter amnicola TaxID=2976241 RepID=A0ABY6BED6_9GAMM|nr:LysR substrate-binding domain-containing protein [Tahibacter amnicola]UXI68147.1 LysR substrate-binding domain-containing protein [Tahibacter amnicola]